MKNRTITKLISLVSLLAFICIMYASAQESSSQWINKGRDLDNNSHYDDAISCYEKAIALEPQNEVAWFNKGLALYKQGKYDEAIQSYDKAIEIDPQDTDAWINKGLALYYQGKYDEAIQSYDKAIEIDPQYAPVSYTHLTLPTIYSV